MAVWCILIKFSKLCFPRGYDTHLIPYSCNFVKSISWFTISKALLKSKNKTPNTMSPSLIDDNLIQKSNKTNICAMFFSNPKLIFTQRLVFGDKNNNLLYIRSLRTRKNRDRPIVIKHHTILWYKMCNNFGHFKLPWKNPVGYGLIIYMCNYVKV